MPRVWIINLMCQQLAFVCDSALAVNCYIYYNAEENYCSKHDYKSTIEKPSRDDRRGLAVELMGGQSEHYVIMGESPVNPNMCRAEVQSGLIPQDVLGSIPKRDQTYVAKLVDACDLKSYPAGCWFNSSHKQMVKQILLFLRRVRSFNKSRYARNRQLARVIFYVAIYINILLIFGIFSLFYGVIFKFSI